MQYDLHTFLHVHMFTKCKKLGHLVDTYSLYINVPKYTCANIWKDVFVISRKKVHFLNISLSQESLLLPVILNIALMKAIFWSIW